METFSFAIGFACAVIGAFIFVAVKATVMARNNKRSIDDMKQIIYDLNKEIGETYKYIDSRIDKVINKGKDKKQILND